MLHRIEVKAFVFEEWSNEKRNEIVSSHGRIGNNLKCHRLRLKNLRPLTITILKFSSQIGFFHSYIKLSLFLSIHLFYKFDILFLIKRD